MEWMRLGHSLRTLFTSRLTVYQSSAVSSAQFSTVFFSPRAAIRLNLGIDDGDLSQSQSRQEGENFGHQGQGFIKLGAADHQHHNRNLKFGGVLLKAQVAVGGQ